MADLLKGNFTPAKPVTDAAKKPDTLEQQFEKAAKKRLGGSIAYVAKNRVDWGSDPTKDGEKK
jgi:hypothetical protein